MSSGSEDWLLKVTKWSMFLVWAKPTSWLSKLMPLFHVPATRCGVKSDEPIYLWFFGFAIHISLSCRVQSLLPGFINTVGHLLHSLATDHLSHSWGFVGTNGLPPTISLGGVGFAKKIPDKAVGSEGPFTFCRVGCFMPWVRPPPGHPFKAWRLANHLNVLRIGALMFKILC